MHVYFLSEKLAALTVNGLYLGTVDGFERTAELDPSDGCFIECKPLSGFLPVKFCFDEALLIAPPPQVAVYHTKSGVAVCCKNFLREDAAMRVIKQQTVAGARITLYVQGRVQLSMQNETGFHLVDLPDELENAAIFEAGDELLLEGGGGFCILTRTGEIAVRSEGKVVARGSVVRAEVPLRDSLGHTALCEWERGKLLSFTLRARQEPTAATYALALFEATLIGADPAPYLTDALAEKADALKEFLGGFVSVVPTDRDGEVGLVYKRKENVFDVRYFRVTVEGGKIANISDCP